MNRCLKCGPCIAQRGLCVKNVKPPVPSMTLLRLRSDGGYPGTLALDVDAGDGFVFAAHVKAPAEAKPAPGLFDVGAVQEVADNLRSDSTVIGGMSPGSCRVNAELLEAALESVMGAPSTPAPPRPPSLCVGGCKTPTRALDGRCWKCEARAGDSRRLELDRTLAALDEALAGWRAAEAIRDPSCACHRCTKRRRRLDTLTTSIHAEKAALRK